MSTPADELRAAAAKLRELAAAATPGPWLRHTGSYPHLVLQGPLDSPPSEADGMISTNLAVNDAADASYIAVMHPGVGAALADWLDAEARGIDAVTHLADLHDGHIEVSVETAPDGRPCYAYSAHQQAIAVARQINAQP